MEILCIYLATVGAWGLQHLRHFDLGKTQVQLGDCIVKSGNLSRNEYYIMLIQQLKEVMVKGSVYCICKPNLKMAFSAL